MMQVDFNLNYLLQSLLLFSAHFLYHSDATYMIVLTVSVTMRNKTLMSFSMLSKNFSRCNFEILFLFFQKIGFAIS